MKKTLTPLQHEARQQFSPKKMMTFDIETGSVAGDALFGPFNYGCLYDGETYTFFSSMDEFLEIALTSPGYTFFAHNAKGYELNYLLDPLRAMLAADPTYSMTTVQQGKQIIQFELKRTTTRQGVRKKSLGKTYTSTQVWKFGDTLPLFSASLEELSKAYCPDLPKLSGSIDFQTEVFDRGNPQHLAYLKRDCEALYVAYRRLERMIFDLFDCGLGLTAGSTAMKAFKASIPDGIQYFRMNPASDVYAREALRGGIVLPGLSTDIQPAMSMFDVKAAYGFHMLTKLFPVGNAIHTFHYQPGKLGVYRAIAHAPLSLKVGCIAERGTSVYPLGTFACTSTSIDIEFAVAHGYTFDITDGFYWEQAEPVFQAFSEKIQTLETTKIDGVAPYKPLAKLVRNSLYGKFGTKPCSENFYVGEDPPEDAQLVLDMSSGLPIDGVYAVRERIDENYMIPIWGACITAYQRAYLMERVYAAYALGATSVYCDTDSITCSTVITDQLKAMGLLEANGRYGSWEYECSGDLLVLAPKVYVLYDPEAHTTKARAKGLPIHAKATLGFTNPELQEMQTYLQAVLGDRKTYEWKTSNSVYSRMKKPSKQIEQHRHRVLSDLKNSSAWDYDSEAHAIRPIIRDGSQLLQDCFKKA